MLLLFKLYRELPSPYLQGPGAARSTMSLAANDRSAEEVCRGRIRCHLALCVHIHMQGRLTGTGVPNGYKVMRCICIKRERERGHRMKSHHPLYN